MLQWAEQKGCVTQGQCYAFHSIHGAKRIEAIPVWHSEWDCSERSSLCILSPLLNVKHTIKTCRKKSRRTQEKLLLRARCKDRREFNRQNYRLSELCSCIFASFQPSLFLSLSVFSLFATPHRPRISQKGILIEAATVNADLPPGNESSHRAAGRPR